MAKSKSPQKKDDFQSEVLSKKDQRKLKKILQKQEEVKEDIESDESDEEEEEDEEELDLEKLARDADSESESEVEDDEEEDKDEVPDENDDEEEDEDEEDVPLSEVEIDSDADIVPHTKLTVNNVGALKDSLARIQLPWTKHSFQEHQSITFSEDVVSQVKDIYDDTQRELAFYKQGLDAALQGRKKLLALKVPFSRPLDYFAEMVKSDEHMDKLKEKLVKEATAKKAGEDAKKQRQLKKFGKQVQNETLQQRQKEKRETLDKIKSLKKKRQNDEMTNDDFDIAIEEATLSKQEYNDRNRKGPGAKRQAKNSKYGSGGQKRFKRKNDAESSSDVSGFSAKRMKLSGGKKVRPGKSSRRRKN